MLSRSFVEMKTLPSEPDMSKLYTEAFLPKHLTIPKKDDDKLNGKAQAHRRMRRL